MSPKLIYLDTNLWNALCDQRVSPPQIVEELASWNACLTLGNEAVYEMAKTFLDSAGEGRTRGTALFSYVYQYLDGWEIPFFRVNMELVAAEMWALQRGSSTPETLLHAADYETTRSDLEKLAHGELSQNVKEYVVNRITSAEANRSRQIAYLKDWPEVKQKFTNVSPEQLPQWLNLELRSQASREHLAGQIKEYFPDATLEESVAGAQALLGSPIGRVSKAIVRRMLYYNWRCAHRQSVSKDIYFDSNHILNANYADVYATKESKQTEYAGLLLTPSTRIEIYDGIQDVERWLIGQAASS